VFFFLTNLGLLKPLKWSIKNNKSFCVFLLYFILLRYADFYGKFRLCENHIFVLIRHYPRWFWWNLVRLFLKYFIRGTVCRQGLQLYRVKGDCNIYNHNILRSRMNYWSWMEVRGMSAKSSHSRDFSNIQINFESFTSKIKRQTARV